MEGFRAEVISDTHLNMWKHKPEQMVKIFSLQAPNLILAGDIGDPDDSSLHMFLNLARNKYKRVFYVPGNHEFYKADGSKKNPAAVLEWFQKLDDQWPNFHFFYRRNELIDGVRILGATCWSTAPEGTEWANLISREGKKDIEFIEQGLSNSIEPVLVISHYPSTLRVIEDGFRGKLSQFNYGQDLERLYRYPLHTWVFGHVHQKHDFSLPYASSLYGTGSVRIICNPYGYPTDPTAARKTLSFQVPRKDEGHLVGVRSPYDTMYQML